MKILSFIWLFLLASVSMMAQAEEETLSFVGTDGTVIAFSTQGLKITFDDQYHALISNAETSSVIDLADMDYMCFGEVTSHIIGDVNLDGEVNIADVNAAIEIVLSSGTDSLADVNADGEINIADINALIEIILNGNS